MLGKINGMPKLMCMTRLNQIPLDQPVKLEPMKTFPLIKDLVWMCRGTSR